MSIRQKTPKAVARRDLIIVIDVLRFGSSVLNAFANGAKAVIPQKTLKEAYKIHAEHPDYLLAGERRGLKPRRFNSGNSPLEFSRERVYGKTLIFTTTSGTSALTRSRAAKWVLIGTFLNADAVAKKAVEIAEKGEIGISLVQSGTKSKFSLEDFICAGAIVERFPNRKINLSDAALAALFAFKQIKDDLCENIEKGEHAKHLIKLGFRKDIEFSCQLDLFSIVPMYKDGIINLLK